MFEPKVFLKSRFGDGSVQPHLQCICPGFELKKWRYERLAAHLMDWLPDFAIRHDELPQNLASITDFRKVLETAARRVYDTDHSSTRGEVGELLLHAICRHFAGTFPTVSKVYYKTSTNDVVKGYDLVHTCYNKQNDELQLWLGEAKFYTDGTSAVDEAITSVLKHLDAGFLTNEKILLGGKVSQDTPGYEKLQWLFERDTPLDEVIDRLVIPILIAYDSERTSSYVDDQSYNDSIRRECDALHSRFSSRLPLEISIHCFYFPMSSKRLLIEEFDKKLEGYL
jgi:Cap4 SAVED domain